MFNQIIQNHSRVEGFRKAKRFRLYQIYIIPAQAQGLFCKNLSQHPIPVYPVSSPLVRVVVPANDVESVCPQLAAIGRRPRTAGHALDFAG